MIIFDIDGVIANSTERENKFIKGRKKKSIDWDLFYESVYNDPPIPSGVLAAKAFINFLPKEEITFVTGRNESVRDLTLKWLSKHLGIAEKDINLIMRPDGDPRTNSAFKEDVGENIGYEKIDIAFDDNGTTVNMWRSHNVKCFQTDKRNFAQNNF